MGFFAIRFSRRKKRLLTLTQTILCLMFISPALGTSKNLKDSLMVKRRDELDAQDKWNVEALYADRTQWDAEYARVKGDDPALRWPGIASYKGRLSDPNVTLSLFNLYFDLDRKLSKLYSYAHLKHDEDLGNDLSKKDYGIIVSLCHDFQRECSWIEPELLALSDEEFSRLESNPSLNPYRFYLERVHRMKPHTMKAEQEELMALSGNALSASSRAFSVLNNADLVFPPAIDQDGKEQMLTHGSYLSFMRSKDRSLRKSAFQNLH
ncbi:MAG: oligoendopeptidase F family protein, partial [Chlamydiae bacterium]|nr:oligoendopeptidase F family protein [Chlamydiota bacterium]